MISVVTKKQLEGLIFGPTNAKYIKDEFDFRPTYNSITYFEVDRQGPGILPASLENVVPVVICKSDGSLHIEKDIVGSKASWKHCSQTSEIFYGEGDVSPKGQSYDDDYEDYDDKYGDMAKTVRIQRSKIRPW